MERQFKRQQHTIGAIVKIPLENGYHSYGRILKVQVAFYDIYTKKDMLVDDVVKQNVLFVTNVYKYTITKGYWQKTGKKLPIEEELLNPPPKYTQDALNPQYYELVYRDKLVPTTKEKCQGLELWAVWTPKEIEERLNDHFKGRTNPFVERMKTAEVNP